MFPVAYTIQPSDSGSVIPSSGVLPGGGITCFRGAVTASQAIRKECRSCQPGQRMTPEGCETKACKLSPNAFECRSSVKRIAAHCRDCNGDDHPRECTGRLLHGKTCPLHPFRLGKNPNAKKRTLSPEHKAKLAETGCKHRFHTGQNRPSGLPGSTISSASGKWA